MAKIITGTTVVKHKKVRRPGVHSKCRTSKSKRSKNYVKAYKGQGK